MKSRLMTAPPPHFNRAKAPPPESTLRLAEHLSLQWRECWAAVVDWAPPAAAPDPVTIPAEDADHVAC